jgi:hypothetical protein
MTLFSVDANALDDPRLQRLPPATFKAWFGLKCVAARYDGALPDIKTLAFMLRSRVDVVERRLYALLGAGLIENRDGGLWIVDDTPPPDPPPRLDPDDGFKEFCDAFPSRNGDNPIEPARTAFRKAVAAGANPKAIIVAAKAYASSTAGRERRYIASAARWLGECRWQGGLQSTTGPNLIPSTAAPGVWISATSPEWWAWSNHWRATKGKSPPLDAKGGWRFPSLNPPEPQPLAA